MAIIISDTPTAEVIASFEADIVHVVSWVDIYEADNTTLWRSHVDVIEGSVSVDMGRDERRNLDLTISDSDGLLGYGPGEFWYDKIIKPYSGIKLHDFFDPSYLRLPGIIGNFGRITRTALSSVTHLEFAVRVELDTLSVGQYLCGWDSTHAFLTLTNANLLQIRILNTLFANIGAGVSAVIPGLAVGVKVWFRGKVTVATAACEYWYSYQDTNDYEAVTWIALGSVAGSSAGTTPLLTESGKVLMGVNSSTGSGGFVGKLYAFVEVVNNAKTIEVDPGGVSQGATSFGAITGQTVNIITSGGNVASIVAPPTGIGDTWVTPLGEFMIDTIGRHHFPRDLAVTGRDFVKKLKLAKFSATTGFAIGTNVVAAIQAIASNGGINKFNFPILATTLMAQVNFDRGSPRWDAMIHLAESISYELYLDNFGYLTLRPYVDPLTAPLAYSFRTGTQGNLITFGRSTSDTQMFNDVIVYGDGPDNASIFAQAENTNVDSPTSIAAVGRRTWVYASAFISTVPQALERAEAFLAVLGLEQYDVSIESFVLPFLEAGEAIEVDLPDSAFGEPNRFLFTSFSLPIGMGTMTGTAKRVSIAGFVLVVDGGVPSVIIWDGSTIDGGTPSSIGTDVVDGGSP